MIVDCCFQFNATSKLSDDLFAMVGNKSYEKRREFLQDNYYFSCNCIVCSSKSWKYVEKMASVIE